MMRTVFSIHGGMVSASSEASKHKYHVYQDHEHDQRRWLVADTETPAENVYVEDPDPNSQGFGGATLTFDLVSGGTLQLKGPWHSNANALFEATGIDIRDKHRTQGIVALKREYLQGRTEYEDVLHLDEVPVIGPYNRISDIAQGFADERGEPVFYAFKSAGGGSSSRMDPTKQEA